MSAYEKIKENLIIQLHELEALEAVYPKELVIADHGVLADINSFIECQKEELPQRLEYSIELSVDGGAVELFVSLAVDYPQDKPEVYVRTTMLDRNQQLLFNKALVAYMEAQPSDEPCVYTLVSWIQDNIENYVRASKANQGKRCNDKNKKNDLKREKPVFSRYWIYSHHIYSKIKRKDITNLMKENLLTGFCLAGKPGIICMEGLVEDCEYCWQQIKVMNWHRILVKLVEEETLEKAEEVGKFRKFTGFQEISFPSSERHNDMGQLLKFLIQHDSQHAFKELFGVEGKFTEPVS